MNTIQTVVATSWYTTPAGAASELVQIMESRNLIIDFFQVIAEPELVPRHDGSYTKYSIVAVLVSYELVIEDAD
jgi:hypothetical protein